MKTSFLSHNTWTCKMSLESAFSLASVLMRMSFLSLSYQSISPGFVIGKEACAVLNHFLLFLMFVRQGTVLVWMG